MTITHESSHRRCQHSHNSHNPPPRESAPFLSEKENWKSFWKINKRQQQTEMFHSFQQTLPQSKFSTTPQVDVITLMMAAFLLGVPVPPGPCCCATVTHYVSTVTPPLTPSLFIQQQLTVFSFKWALLGINIISHTLLAGAVAEVQCGEVLTVNIVMHK